MSDESNRSIEVLSEELDNLIDDFEGLLPRVEHLEQNVQSIVGMMTQMNISLLQIQNDVLGKENE